MSRDIRYLHRHELGGFLKRLTDCRPSGRPLFPFFSCFAFRRTPLELRYDPIDQYNNGPLARVGDHSLIGDKDKGIIRDMQGRVFQLRGTTPRDPIFLRRGTKIILEDIGTGRWMILKNYAKEAPRPTKHWQPKGRSLRFNPREHDLFLFQGAYNDLRKSNGRIGRHGQWRSFTTVCLRSLTTIRCRGIEWRVIEPPIIAQPRQENRRVA